MPRSEKTRFLKMGDVRERYGCSHMWIERRLADDPTFPRPALIVGKRRFWKLEELEAWERKAAARSSAA